MKPAIAVHGALLAAIALSAMSGAAHAADPYPSKPLTLVIGFPPGGGADQVGRVYANALARQLKQPVVVENRPGAGSTIGASLAARAAADGYTLYLGNSSVMGSDSALYKVDYTPDNFVPVAQLTTGPMVLIANAKLGLKSVQDLIDRARSKPGSINVASSGNGVITHLAAVEFMTLANVKLMHIPFKGGRRGGAVRGGGRHRYLVRHGAFGQVGDRYGQGGGPGGHVWPALAPVALSDHRADRARL